MLITGYCDASCGKVANDPAYGIMANGERTHLGVIACPPEWPFGTRIKVVGLPGWYTCKDRGGAIHENRLDIWFRTCEEAIIWGSVEKQVVILRGFER